MSDGNIALKVEIEEESVLVIFFEVATIRVFNQTQLDPRAGVLFLARMSINAGSPLRFLLERTIDRDLDDHG